MKEMVLRQHYQHLVSNQMKIREEKIRKKLMERI